MSGYTPGPWSLWGNPDPSQAIASVDGFIARTVGGNDLANARLIAAAPDLLAACLAALPRLAHKHSCCTTRPTSEWAEHGSVSFENCDCEIKKVRAAIAKAITAEQAGVEK